jgi:hypothetical protein
MGILVGSWLSIGLVTLVSPPGGTSEALGVLLLLAGGAMLIPASAAALDVRFALCRPDQKPDYDASATGRRVAPVQACAPPEKTRPSRPIHAWHWTLVRPTGASRCFSAVRSR